MKNFGPRKTATFIPNPKVKFIFDAQKYELDEKQVYDFYKIIPKQEPIYNVIKKQVAFGKDIKYNNKMEKNKKYSNYCLFRELMQKELDIEDIKVDIEQTKLLLNSSENMRIKFYSYFHMDRNDYIKSKKNNDFNYNKFINIRKNDEKKNIINNNEELIPNNDFLKQCIMLRRKREEDDNKQIPKKFTIYSDLNIQSTKFDAINYFVNKNKLSEKYYEEKSKLIKCFNRESRFINFNKLIKQSTIQEISDNLQINIKDKYSSDYFDLIYGKKDELYFESIDQFFSKYKITNYKLKNSEADFYGKIYGILCKNNYLKFLSFLYSKNKLFKYIYDQFSDKDATSMEYSDELFMEKNFYNESFFEENEESFGDFGRQKELMGNNFNKKKIKIGTCIRNIDEEEKKDKKKNEERKNLLDKIINSYIYIKIGYLNENIKFKYIKEFFEKEENEEDEEDNEDEKKNKKFYKNYLKKISKEPFNYFLLITSNNKMIITEENNNNIFEQKMSEINFIKIEKEYLKTILNKKIKSLYSSEDGDIEYYLFQNKINNTKNEYYLFKILKKNTRLFDKQISDNFTLIKIKDFIENIETNKEKEKEKEKKKEKEKEEKIENIIKKSSENEEEEKEKSEKDEIKEHNIEEQFAGPSSFNKDEIISEKNSASILNDDSDINNIDNIMKMENLKKTSEYQREHKNYEFDINKEKYFFDIYQGQLRCKTNNNNIKIYNLKDIIPQNVEQDNENSCYKLIIKKGDKVIFRIRTQDKLNLNNFYDDIIKTKKQFGYN